MLKSNNENKTVVITGAAGGLGVSLSIHFAQSGFTTILLDSNQKMLESVWDMMVEKALPRPILHPLDLATAGPDQFDEMIAALNTEFNCLDGLIHCAAKFDGLRPLDQVSPGDWSSQIQVNLNAAWLLSVTCLPLLRKSTSAFLYFLLEDMEKMKKAYWGAYGVSKYALKALVHQFAIECASTPVQVLGINPGPLASRLRAEAYHAENPGMLATPDIAAVQILKIALGQSEVTDVVVHLDQVMDC